MQKSDFVYRSFLLLCSNLIVRLISFGYNIFLSKSIGAEGMGIFKILMPTLMLFLVVSSGGIPTAVSKLVAEKNSTHNTYGTRKIFKVAFFITFFLALFLSFLLFISAKYFSIKVFGSTDKMFFIYLLIPAILVISFSSLIRGYFFGIKKIVISSVSEIIEHILRFTIVFALIYYFKPSTPEAGALIAVLGISLGEIFGLLWLTFNYIRLSKNTTPTFSNDSILNISQKIGAMAIPLTLSAMFGIIFKFINAMILPTKLINLGLSNSEATATFGRIMGMAMPLISFPMVVTSALVVNIIPTLSSHFRLKNYKDAKRDISYAIKITLLISIPLSLIYMAFPDKLALYLYNDIEVGKFIFIMSSNTIFLSIRHISSGILNGIGQQIHVVINQFIGMLLFSSSIYFLVDIPSIGVNGFFIGFIGSTLIVCLLDYIVLKKELNFKLKDIINPR